MSADTGAKADAESNWDAIETDATADAEKPPEETLDSKKGSQAVSVSEQDVGVETVGSELGSKKGGEDEKTEENATADSASAVKESSSVEGDDQNKRFVAFCLLETKMATSLALALLCYVRIGCSFQGGKADQCICRIARPALLPGIIQ